MQTNDHDDILRTKNDLVLRVAKKAGLASIEARRAVDAIIDSLASLTEQDEMLSLRGLGTFKPVTRKPRICRLATGTYEVPAYRSVVFKPSRTLRR